MASAMHKMYDQQHFDNSGSEPDQEWTQLYTDYSDSWTPSDYDWTTPGYLDDILNFDWMGPPLENPDTANCLGMTTEWDENADANLQGLLQLDGTQQGFLAPMSLSHLEQSDPAMSSPSSISPPSNTSPSTSSSQSPPKPPETPMPQTVSSPAPKNLHICTICQPNRSYATLQDLK